MQDLVGVILAAGKGSRMGQLSLDIPKTVLPIMDEPLLYTQLRMMRELGIDKAYVVVGHLGYHVVKEIERMPDLGIRIEYVPQEDTLGIAHCVGRLEPYIDQEFLLFLGDIYFVAPDISSMVSTMRERSAAGVLGAIEETSREALQKNFCILTREDGSVHRVIEKPRQPLSMLKGVGLYLFNPVVFDAIRRTPRTAMRNEYEITDSIQIMIDDGHTVYPSCCIREDLNLTYPEDLLGINMRVLKAHGLDSHVGTGASVPGDAVLRRTVVCREAVVGAGARLEQCLVFPEARVPDGADLKRCVVTPRELFRL